MYKNWYIADSKIHGKGVFAARDIQPNEIIDVALYLYDRNYFQITRNFGAYINHKSTPLHNIDLVKNGKLWYSVSNKYIKKGEELVSDYNTLPSFLKRPEKHFK